MRSVKYDIWSSRGRRFDTDAAKPSLEAKDSVVVDVKAAGINPVDYKLPKWFFHGKGIGLDFSGVVTQVSPDVQSVAVGDRVFGNTRGALSEQVVCNASHIAKLPTTFSFQEGAALPTAYLTSYQAFVNHGFEAGMKVLVIGASGGCGSAGVQLAKAMGASEVVGVCSKKNEEFVKSLGADRIIDYQTQSIVDGNAQHFDFVLDTATASGGGENYLDDAKKVLKDPSKNHVALNGPPSLWLGRLTPFGRKDIDLIMTEHKSADLEGFLKHLEQAGSRPVIDSVFPFTQEGVEEAFAKLASRRVKGKVVVDVGGQQA
ncbi:hypothetical protein AeMF1_018205 [Aphanomyces euteiches]|nr:hypothetical protein AeMF1_018205 [Aphanomyces euteiches]